MATNEDVLASHFICALSARLSIVEWLCISIGTSFSVVTFGTQTLKWVLYAVDVFYYVELIIHYKLPPCSSLSPDSDSVLSDESVGA
jgi:hypothetical protein